MTVAEYGFLLACVSLYWHMYTWWTTKRPHLAVKVAPEMVVMGADGRPFVQVTVSNRGHRATTLQGLYIRVYPDFLKRLLGKSVTSLAAAASDSPYGKTLLDRLEPGDSHTGLYDRKGILEALGSNVSAVVVFEIHHSMGRPKTQRVAL